MGTAGNKISKWESSIEKIIGHNCPNRYALPYRARLATAQLGEEASLAHGPDVGT